MTDQHIDDNGKHIEELDQRLRELSAAFTGLGDTGDIEELLRVIHFPGWTSLRDVFFVNTLMDIVQQTTVTVEKQRAALRDGIQRIAADTAS
jgi:hypothetical protein